MPQRKQRKQRNFIEYYGHLITRNTTRPNTLRWSCIGIGAADTLAGMKELIRVSIGK